MSEPNHTNLAAVQKFARAPALLSAGHAHELLALAASPPRNLEATGRHLEQVAASYGVAVPSAERKPFLFANGIAVIPVWGALLHRDPWCDSYATGYDYIASRFAMAMADDDVQGIVLDVNSYGGHVAGNFELAKMIREARDVKPSAAIIDARAMSGGYSLASACSRMYATPSADVGSIGVVLTHMSYEKLLEKAGIEVTFVFSGKHKVDGNPYQDLPEDVKAALQTSVARSYDQFVSLVCENRGLDADAVRATEAGVFDAEKALSLKLVDAVMPARAAYAAFQEEVASAGSNPTKSENKSMSQNTNQKRAGGDEEEITQTHVSEARAAGAADEQKRIGAIMGCDEAAGREQLAKHFAFSTSMSAEDAQKALAVAPKESKAEPASPGAGRLAAAMAPETNVTVGVENANDNANDNRQASRADRLVQAHAKATGRNSNQS